MAQRRRRSGNMSVDRLIAELSSLDLRRNAVVKSIQSAVSSVMGALPSLPSTGRKRGRPAGSKNATATAPRPRRKMSAKARKAIGDAQRKRWAAQKAAKK